MLKNDVSPKNFENAEAIPVEPDDLEPEVEDVGPCQEDTVYVLSDVGNAEKLNVPDDTEEQEEPHASYD